MAKHVIRLPNGKTCSLRTYVDSWRALKGMRPELDVNGFDHFPTPAKSILRALRAGMHDRINRHVPGYGQGRKWSSDWQRHVRQAAWQVNTPRLILNWLPLDLTKAFSTNPRIQNRMRHNTEV